MKSPMCLTAIVGFLLLSQQANACECVLLTPSQETRWADTILVAEVSNVERKQVTLLPIEVIKGKINQPLIFSIGRSNCDYFSIPDDVHVGDRHLLYLRLRNGKPYASICSRSSPITPITKKGVELEEFLKQFK